MRVLIATDGSPAAQRAVDLAAAETWPPDTALRVVTVVESEVELVDGPWPAFAIVETEDLSAELVRAGEAILEQASAGLRAAGVAVETAVLRGHPADAVVREARRWGADLIVVGNRGNGPFTSLVLGSVSAAIVDLSPLPVLVARGGPVRSLILGIDGSAGAEAAQAVVTAWPIFEGVHVHVTAVVDLGVPWWTGMAEVAGGTAYPAYLDAAEERRGELEKLVARVAGDLREAGHPATSEVRDGDAAHELVHAARERQADLVVVGSRGLTGLPRLVLGSVARNVLYHAPCSVLIVHAPRVGAAAAPAEAAGRRSLGGA